MRRKEDEALVRPKEVNDFPKVVSLKKLSKPTGKTQAAEEYLQLCWHHLQEGLHCGVFAA